MDRYVHSDGMAACDVNGGGVMEPGKANRAAFAIAAAAGVEVVVDDAATLRLSEPAAFDDADRACVADATLSDCADRGRGRRGGEPGGVDGGIGGTGLDGAEGDTERAAGVVDTLSVLVFSVCSDLLA